MDSQATGKPMWGPTDSARREDFLACESNSMGQGQQVPGLDRNLPQSLYHPLTPYRKARQNKTDGYGSGLYARPLTSRAAMSGPVKRILEPLAT